MKTILAIAISFLLMTGAVFAQSSATAPSEPAPTKSATFRPTKDQIKQGQAMLKDQKLFAGEATGKYDDATRVSIKSYQKANGLDENGKFDRATLTKMNIALTDSQKGTVGLVGPSDSKANKAALVGPSDSSAVKRPAPFRANADQITSVQRMLRDGKMLTGGVDGELDDTTRDALGKYQEANGLKVTKTLNSMTLTKMGVALTEKQKEQVAAQAAYDAAKPAKP